MIQDKQTLYNNLFEHLRTNLDVLQDKPEETVVATLKALWFTAHGEPKSAQLACMGELPDLNLQQAKQLQHLCERRLEGIPLAHITGRQQFMGIELLASPDALIPRKETELLGKAAVNIIDTLLSTHKKKVNIIDLCTGAGNLPIAYAFNRIDVQIYAADLSPEAVTLARRNVDFHHMQDRIVVEEGDLLSPFDQKEFYNNIDLLTCNPPYISSANIGKMPTEISEHEPRLAFDGGPFGMGILYKLVKEAPKYLKSGGWLAFEVGLGQGPTMVKFINKFDNYSDIKLIEDDDGNIRVIIART